MKQPFDTAELKTALEHSLGFALRSLERLDGASALNFRAERAGDGMVFAVKCSPPERWIMHRHLVRHLEEMRGTRAVHRIFADSAPAKFRDYDVVCLEWCPGVRRFPDTLSPDELDAMVDDYLEFSAAMQRATLIIPHDPTDQWRAEALECVGGCWGGWLRRLLETDLTPETTVYRPERLRTVHGDFHHGNFLFDHGRVAGYFDLEEFCQGYPADDFVRYFVCAAEHLRWYEQHRRRRILEMFARAVRRLPYPTDEWVVAINCLFIRKLHSKLRSPRLGCFQSVNLRFRYGLYRTMKEIVDR